MIVVVEVAESGAARYFQAMADVFWKVLAALIFILIMTGMRFVMSWGYDLLDPKFGEGMAVGAMSVAVIFLLAHWVEKKGWLS